MLMEFEQIEYTYPCNQAQTLQKLNLTIPSNKACALIGRNGCGKSTLFRLANGLYRPQSGVIRWQGKPLKYDRPSLTQLRQQVGLVFQDPEQQLVGATVVEDLSYGLCNLGLPEAEIARRVQQTIVEFELTNLANTPINYLSLGQKKRVSLADVMILEPQLLLLDEPTAYLDPYQTKNLLVMLDKIRAKGTTIVVATHNLDFAYTWADWIFVMEQGKLVMEGNPDMVFNEGELLEELGLGKPLALQFIPQIITSSDNNLNSLTNLIFGLNLIQQSLNKFITGKRA